MGPRISWNAVAGLKIRLQRWSSRHLPDVTGAERTIAVHIGTVSSSTRNTTLNGREVTVGVESFGGYVMIASTDTIVPSGSPGNMLSPENMIGDYAAHRDIFCWIKPNQPD